MIRYDGIRFHITSCEILRYLCFMVSPHLQSIDCRITCHFSSVNSYLFDQISFLIQLHSPRTTCACPHYTALPYKSIWELLIPNNLINQMGCCCRCSFFYFVQVLRYQISVYLLNCFFPMIPEHVCPSNVIVVEKNKFIDAMKNHSICHLPLM